MQDKQPDTAVATRPTTGGGPITTATKVLLGCVIGLICLIALALGFKPGGTNAADQMATRNQLDYLKAITAAYEDVLNYRGMKQMVVPVATDAADLKQPEQNVDHALGLLDGYASAMPETNRMLGQIKAAWQRQTADDGEDDNSTALVDNLRALFNQVAAELGDNVNAQILENVWDYSGDVATYRDNAALSIAIGRPPQPAPDDQAGRALSFQNRPSSRLAEDLWQSHYQAAQNEALDLEQEILRASSPTNTGDPMTIYSQGTDTVAAYLELITVTTEHLKAGSLRVPAASGGGFFFYFLLVVLAGLLVYPVIPYGHMSNQYEEFKDTLAEIEAGSFDKQVALVGSGNNEMGMLALRFNDLMAAIDYQIKSFQNTFGEFAIGNFEARVPVIGQNDLADLAVNFNQLQDSIEGFIQSQEEKDRIQSNIQKLLDEIAGVADGDLTTEAEVTAEVTGAIADAFNMMISELRDIIGNVSETTFEVSSSANEIQSTAEILAEGSEIQAQQIVDASAAIEEMAVSIQQVSENAATSAEVAQQARTNAQTGADTVRKTINGMTMIREQVQETSKRIKRLGESSQEIGEIIQLIGDIADRTSILALNASIQAAMAGDAGRGFAVVAQEVERLAERATDATKQIATIISTIQTDTTEAVTAMEETTQQVISGSQNANEAGQALDAIGSVSDQLAELIQSISAASKQQARGSESIAKSMNDISQITQQTAAGTKQASVSIANLAEMADGLGDSMKRFTVPSSRGDFAA